MYDVSTGAKLSTQRPIVVVGLADAKVGESAFGLRVSRATVVSRAGGAHSKWAEVFVMKTTNSEKTVEKLRSVFAAYGLPEVVVTDNGPQFTSTQFATFLSRNGIRHVKSPPYHPASNGSAERCVQTIKRDLFKQVLDEQRTGESKTLQHRIDQFLFRYRNTPTGTTDETPAQRFLSWKPRTRLSLLHPDMEKRMTEKLERIRE